MEHLPHAPHSAGNTDLEETEPILSNMQFLPLEEDIMRGQHSLSFKEDHS